MPDSSTEETITRTPSRSSSNAEMPTDADFEKPTRFAAGFWDRDPETTKHRKIYLKVVTGGSFVTILVIFAVLSIYWGSLWKVNLNIHHLNGWIVDFDDGRIGQAVREGLLNITGPLEQITWSVVNASQFANGPNDVADAVVKERCWVAVTINPGATDTLDAAIANANGSYNGSLAVTAYAVEARNENSYPLFIVPLVQGSFNAIATQFAAANSRQIASNGSLSLQTLLSNAPSVVTQPLSFTMDNLRPFDVPVATAVDFVGLIYLLILSFIVAMMNFNARVVLSGLTHHLRMKSLLMLRVFSPLIMYFFVSAFYALLSLAFQTPFNRNFGHSGFVIFWMLNWMGMSALGLAMEAMITLLTPAFAPFFLVLWIISNVSVCFFPIQLLPGVFRYGYATPFYNVSRAVRTVVFNTRNEIGLNFGVLFAWIGISLITLPTFQYLIRRRAEKQWARQHAVLNKA